MASTSAVSMAMPLTQATQTRQPNADSFFKPLPVLRSSKAASTGGSATKFQIKASSSSSSSSSSSIKEKAVTGLTAAALTASMMIPDVAEAADGVTPSLKNFLLNIGAGGAVVVLILGAVIAVSNFDPVNRS